MRALAALARPGRPTSRSCPARVVMQDFTGVPAVVDLAAMRDAMARAGGDPARINPLVPADLVIDHSVQVDRFGTRRGLRRQRRARVRAQRRALRAAALGAAGVRRLPRRAAGHRDRAPGEPGVPRPRRASRGDGGSAFPDTLVGTDSHTTMINGLGVLGFGVGGIEAEAVLLGQPLLQPTPTVIGLRLRGALPAGATATDLVLTVTEMLRAHGVVGKFVEFFGDGLSAADPGRPRDASPTCRPSSAPPPRCFPIDDETLRYLQRTGRGRGSSPSSRPTQGAGPVPHRRRPGPRASTRRSSSTWARSMPSLAGPRGRRTAWPCGRLGSSCDVPREPEPDPRRADGRSADGAGGSTRCPAARSTPVERRTSDLLPHGSVGRSPPSPAAPTPRTRR